LITILGTDLAIKLRDEKFSGMVIIRSANSSVDDFKYYMSTGAIDLCVSKSGPNKELAVQIESAYALRVLRRGKKRNWEGESL
jgi:FixJ family two-component response regulator